MDTQYEEKWTKQWFVEQPFESKKKSKGNFKRISKINENSNTTEAVKCGMSIAVNAYIKEDCK